MFTATQSAEVWDRWQRGEGLTAIGRVFGKTSSAIFAHLKPHGGIRPAPRRRSRRMLGMDEREEISRGMAAGERPWKTLDYETPAERFEACVATTV